MCGVDATDLYDRYHEDHPEYMDLPGIDYKGELTEETEASDDDDDDEEEENNSAVTAKPAVVSHIELIEHSNHSDCWVVLYQNVYDLSNASILEAMALECGEEVTVQFAEMEGNPSDTQFLFSLGPYENMDDNTTVMSMEELSRFNTSENCLESYYGEVYNMTEYIDVHPGGTTLVFFDCGAEATEEYSIFHNYSQLVDIEAYFVGYLYVEHKPVLFDLEELAKHNDAETDCVISYYGEVYNITEYIPLHPGGAAFFDCGTDQTDFYAEFHDYVLLFDMHPYYMGQLVF